MKSDIFVGGNVDCGNISNGDDYGNGIDPRISVRRSLHILAPALLLGVADKDEVLRLEYGSIDTCLL